ncbi:MAG: hypothetical protein ABSE08_07770 [Syntrophobacteraceae bacterium]|jgi:hypothetical protein
MKNEQEKIYNEWIRRRQFVPVPEGISERVMSKIAKQPARGRFDLPVAYRILSSHPVQWAAALGALSLGLFRLSYITTVLLSP